MKTDLQFQVIETTTEAQTEASDLSFASTSEATHDVPQWASIQTYHEMADVPVKEVDVLEAIEANLAQLEDMQARLRFMVREVKYLLKA